MAIVGPSASAEHPARERATEVFAGASRAEAGLCAQARQSGHRPYAPLRRRAFLALLPGALSCGNRKAEGFAGYAFVANSAGRAVAVIDLGAFAATRHVLLDADPVQLLRHPNKARVFALTPAAGAIHEIDATALEAVRRARCDRSATSMRFGEGGDTLWVLSPAARTVAGFETASLRAAGRHALPHHASDWDVSPDGRLAAFAFETQGAVGLLDLASGSLRVAAVGDGTADLVRFRSDGRQLLVGDRARRRLSVLDAGTLELIVHLPLAVSPRHFCFKPDGGQLFITGDGLDAVVTVHPYQTQIGSTTLAGPAPGPMGASVDPSYLFVTNPGAGDVTVIDIETQRVIAVVAAGAYPCHVTVTPGSEYALVLNRDSGDMAVIRLAALTGRRGRLAPLFTMVPAGSRPVSAVVWAVTPTGA